MKFNIVFYYSGYDIRHKKIDLKGCESIKDVRTWLNVHNKFVNIGDIIHNLDRVDYIKIKAV